MNSYMLRLLGEFLYATVAWWVSICGGSLVDSVVEFAVGNERHSYFATSYPYRAEYADVDDIRAVAQ